MVDIFQKYIDMLSDSDYTNKIQPMCTENMERLFELITKLDNLKHMDTKPK